MPSYRVHLPVGEVRAGYEPPEVLDALVTAVGSHVVVEHQDVEVVRGVPRCVVRFLVPPSCRAEEDAQAHRIADDGVDAVSQVATCGTPLLTRRDHGRFAPVL